MIKQKMDDQGNVQMVGMVVGVLVTLIIAVLVFYNVSSAIDHSDIDDNIQENVYGFTGNDLVNDNVTYAGNSTDDIMDQAATFFTIAPIIAIVIVAVIILKYVGDI